ncbi:MAG: hypothetical protein Q8M22_08795 [Actinomycetota bacterium]|nr:hypothetical protein [Actinomycetota bacterium]
MTSVGDQEVGARHGRTPAPHEVAESVLRAAPVPVLIVAGEGAHITHLNDHAAGRLGTAALGRSLHDHDLSSCAGGATEVLVDAASATRLVFLAPATERSERIELANRLHDRAIPAAMAVGLRIELARGLAAPAAHSHLDHAATILAELSASLRDEMHLLAGIESTAPSAPTGGPGSDS